MIMKHMKVKGSLVYRTLRNVRWASLGILGINYIHHQHKLAKQDKRRALNPTGIHLEVTTECKMKCHDCYVDPGERQQEDAMSSETARKTIGLGRRLGIRTYNIMGGETMTRKTVPLLETITKENPLTSFFICTNACLLATDKEYVSQLARQPNLFYVLSIDGFRETNDAIRYKGSFSHVLKASRILHRNKTLYGAVITVRPQNLKEVTSTDFLRFLVSEGFLYAVYNLCERRMEFDVKALAYASESVPIGIYINELATVSGANHMSTPRTIYVKKDGTIINDRRLKTKLCTVDEPIDFSKNSDWLMRFK